jgi:hypothetical protein
MLARLLFYANVIVVKRLLSLNSIFVTEAGTLTDVNFEPQAPISVHPSFTSNVSKEVNCLPKRHFPVNPVKTNDCIDEHLSNA